MVKATNRTNPNITPHDNHTIFNFFYHLTDPLLRVDLCTYTNPHLFYAAVSRTAPTLISSCSNSKRIFAQKFSARAVVAVG